MKEWRTACLGDVVDVRIGPFGSLLHKEDYTEDGVPLVNPMHIDGGTIVADRRHSVKEEKAVELAGYRMMPGDVVMGRRGEMGRCAVVQPAESGFLCGTGSLFLRPDDDVSPEFLAKLMSSPDMVRRLERASLGTTMPNLNRTIVSNIEVALPPIEEQRRIAAILDHADALRAKRREALARLDELTQSIFIDMFGDPATNSTNLELVTIGDLLDSAQYGTSEKSGAEGEFAVLRMNNITYHGQMDFADLKYGDLPADKVDRFTVRAGDVLFNRTNSAELVGKTAVYHGERPMAFAGYLVRLRVSNGNSPEYISAFLNSRYGKAVLRGMCKSIVGMANINAREVQSIRIPKASTSAQKQFEQRVRLAEAHKASHHTALAELDALFASLQSRAFRGEL